MTTHLWQKTDADEGGSVDAATLRFTVGDDYLWDRRLLPYDVRATRAHAWGLVQAGVLTEAELERVEAGLDALLEAFEAGAVTVRPEDEDAHTVIERYLTEEVGPVGGKVHTGRSRNDQVLAALRLYLRDALAALGRQADALARALIGVADRYEGVLLPGYTHMQRAMPSTVALWALGHAETLAGDLDTLREARRTVNVSPLGSAAGYGVPHLDLPRGAVAERLGFRKVQTHATAVQLARGKHELAVAHACVQVAASVNRLAADLAWYATAEMGFVELEDAHCTGSSIMPQKKNPDVVELARAHYHRLVGRMQTLATLPANLPSGYHRDLQLTKGAVMEAVQGTGDLLAALRPVVEAMDIDRERAQAACTPEVLATQRALARVADGVPFRTAYREAAQAPTPEEVDPAAVLDAYVTAGGPGREDPGAVRRRLDAHAWTRDEAAGEAAPGASR
jgi:argininosuccinate lyase